MSASQLAGSEQFASETDSLAGASHSAGGGNFSASGCNLASGGVSASGRHLASENQFASGGVYADAKVLCADIGTTSLKAAVIGRRGNVLAYSQKFFPISDAGNVAKNWLPALVSAWQEMNKCADKNQAAEGSYFAEGEVSASENVSFAGGSHSANGEIVFDVDAICISGNGPTVVSENGRTILWNEKISTPHTDGTLAAKSLFLPRIAAFLAQHHDVYLSTEYVFSGPEFLIYQLTGKAVTILPEERYRTAYWTDEQIKSISGLDVEKKLPKYVTPGQFIGNVTDDMAKKFGFRKNVQVFGAGPDFIAAMIGTNSLAPGKWYDCAGSSEGLNLCSPVAENFSGLRLLPSVSPSLWNIAALETESGRIFQNHKQVTEAHTGQKISYEQLIDICLDQKDSEGFAALCFVAENFRKMVLRIQEAAEKIGLEMSPFVTVTGGQAKNARWMQFKCDTAKIPLAVCNNADAELTGNAVAAFKGLGFYNSIEEAANDIVKITKIYEPK